VQLGDGHQRLLELLAVAFTSASQRCRHNQKHKAESWKTCAPHGKPLVAPSHAVPGACIARNCQGPGPAAHFTASASGTQGLTYAVSQERFLRSTQTDSYRMCLGYCTRPAILPLPWQLQGLGTSTRGVLAVNSSTAAGVNAGCSSSTGIHVFIRLDLPNGNRIAPGKIALLEAIRAEGSITAAAWYLPQAHQEFQAIAGLLRLTLSSAESVRRLRSSYRVWP
jgi:hypothetical protein